MKNIKIKKRLLSLLTAGTLLLLNSSFAETQVHHTETVDNEDKAWGVIDENLGRISEEHPDRPVGAYYQKNDDGTYTVYIESYDGELDDDEREETKPNKPTNSSKKKNNTNSTQTKNSNERPHTSFEYSELKYKDVEFILIGQHNTDDLIIWTKNELTIAEQVIVMDYLANAPEMDGYYKNNEQINYNFVNGYGNHRITDKEWGRYNFVEHRNNSGKVAVYYDIDANPIIVMLKINVLNYIDEMEEPRRNNFFNLYNIYDIYEPSLDQVEDLERDLEYKENTGKYEGRQYVRKVN